MLFRNRLIQLFLSSNELSRANREYLFSPHCDILSQGGPVKVGQLTEVATSGVREKGNTASPVFPRSYWYPGLRVCCALLTSRCCVLHHAADGATCCCTASCAGDSPTLVTHQLDSPALKACANAALYSIHIRMHASCQRAASCMSFHVGRLFHGVLGHDACLELEA